MKELFNLKSINFRKTGVLSAIFLFGMTLFLNNSFPASASAQSVLSIAKGGTNANSAQSAQINLGRTDTISSSSTDNQFPSSKAVYDYINLQFPEFIALGTNGDYIYSHDGLVWSKPKKISNAESINWQNSIYGGGQFIAVGDSGKVSTSKDGTKWTNAVSVPSAESTNFRSITFGNNYFLATTQSGIIVKCLITNDCSVNSNWSTTFSGYTYGAQSIAFGNGRFWGSHEANFLSTNNGESWSNYAWPDGTGWSTTIFYGLGFFWAGGDNNVAKCPEGSTTWVNTGEKFYPISGTTDGKQTIVMTSGFSNISYSKDSGNSFTHINISSPIRQVVYKDGNFWGIATDEISYSPDGITWQSVALPSGSWKTLAVK
jgi:hypothetical protein